MSRWSYGTWVMVAVAMDDLGNILPLSKIDGKNGFKAELYYEQPSFYGVSTYYKGNDFAGKVDSKYEGSFDIKAHVKLTDKSGNTKSFEKLCEGYTCCGVDCYMLLIVTLGSGVSTSDIEFQEVDIAELEEAVGKEVLKGWMYSKSDDKLIEIDGPSF